MKKNFLFVGGIFFFFTARLFVLLLKDGSNTFFLLEIKEKWNSIGGSLSPEQPLTAAYRSCAELVGSVSRSASGPD